MSPRVSRSKGLEVRIGFDVRHRVNNRPSFPAKMYILLFIVTFGAILSHLTVSQGWTHGQASVCVDSGAVSKPPVACYQQTSMRSPSNRKDHRSSADSVVRAARYPVFAGASRRPGVQLAALHHLARRVLVVLDAHCFVPEAQRSGSYNASITSRHHSASHCSTSTIIPASESVGCAKTRFPIFRGTSNRSTMDDGRPPDAIAQRISLWRLSPGAPSFSLRINCRHRRLRAALAFGLSASTRQASW